MFKVTPNPPASSGMETIDPQAVDRALAHYIQPEGHAPRPPSSIAPHKHPVTSQSREDALVNASSILDSAAATAYENADNLTGANRKVAMGIVHLIELAQRQVDSVIEEIAVPG
ncbi:MULTISPECIES: hypothetical protein [unclassified Pseudomonas]|uniref:DUF6124 family protein n=1 Tax=unclassified Pseudomonas TaxID=196821 RepID=UPI00128D184C|nr:MULTISPECIES: hypothetical protein [unclassified Pseudomonas]MPQ68759.1 hypothetical protein [Pseudomonas sp. MWU12-2323]